MEPHIEYATSSDGARIASFSIGAGKPLLIAATPPWSHVQQEMRIPPVGAWLRTLAERAQIVRYDCRGTGLSSREQLDFSVDAQVRDMAAVADHYGLRSFAIWGSIGGGAASMAYAARHPERVSHLLLWGAYATGASIFRRREWLALEGLLRADWRIFTDAYAQVAFGWPDSETASQYAELMRAAVTHDGMLMAARQMAAIDVTDEARSIRTPTLVMTRRGATISGVPEARELAALIPTARLHILEGSSHAPFLDDPDAVTTAIGQFMTAEPEPRAPKLAVAALTDRETQVLRLLARGLTGKEIAARLGVSLATVQRHVANIYAKIGARGRVEAVAYAFEQGLTLPTVE